MALFARRAEGAVDSDSVAMHCRLRKAHLLATPRAHRHSASSSRKGEPVRAMAASLYMLTYIRAHGPSPIPCPRHVLYARIPNRVSLCVELV